MSELNIWVAESKQIDPNDFYVKVDGSDFYTAYWVVCSSSKEKAQKLVIDVSEELVLGETEIIGLQLYTSEALVKNEEITERIQQLVDKFQDQEDAQIAAWVSSSGGLW